MMNLALVNTKFEATLRHQYFMYYALLCCDRRSETTTFFCSPAVTSTSKALTFHIFYPTSDCHALTRHDRTTKMSNGKEAHIVLHELSSSPIIAIYTSLAH